MDKLPVILAGSMRPVVDDHQRAALEVVQTNGARFLIVLSGEGLKGVAEDILAFLADNPLLAGQKSQPRQ